MSFAIPTVTGWSTFWQNPIQNVQQPPYAMAYARSGHERLASIALGASGFRGIRAAIRALNGAAPGGAVSDTNVRIVAPVGGDQAGGVRPVETVTNISGVTTAAQRDVINTRIIDQIFNQAPTSYPVDLSGNGGGGKRGF